MPSTSFTCFYERFQIHPVIYDTVHKIYHHQNIRKKEQLKYSLEFVTYNDSITVTIEDESGTHTFLIDNFHDYITIFSDINSSQYSSWKILMISSDVIHSQQFFMLDANSAVIRCL